MPISALSKALQSADLVLVHLPTFHICILSCLDFSLQCMFLSFLIRSLKVHITQQYSRLQILVLLPSCSKYHVFSSSATL